MRAAGFVEGPPAEDLQPDLVRCLPVSGGDDLAFEAREECPGQAVASAGPDHTHRLAHAAGRAHLGERIGGVLHGLEEWEITLARSSPRVCTAVASASVTKSGAHVLGHGVTDQASSPDIDGGRREDPPVGDRQIPHSPCASGRSRHRS